MNSLLKWATAIAFAISTPTVVAAKQPKPLNCAGAPANSKHVLFLMLLNAPPRVANPDWAFQNAATAEFDSCEACDVAARSIANSISKTPTINIAGWCFPKNTTTGAGIPSVPTIQGPVSPDLDIPPSHPPVRHPIVKPLDLN